MNTLLVAINSKFTHTSLSVRTLSANAGDVPFCEFTINEEQSDVASAIFEKQPDVICFSCYIWNIEYILKLASTLRKMIPEVKIVLGGPEVSFCAEELLKKNSFVDAVIRGEGEETFRELIDNGFDFKNVAGVTFRTDTVVTNPDRDILPCLESLVFPYTNEDLNQNCGKLIYYESSRGCPYNCSYCLSSTIHGVRFKSIDKVKSELTRIIKAKPKTVKFTDRTFNADKKRTVELIRFMTEQGQGVTFHFEIEAHTLNDEFFEAVKDAPDGMFRFEIGLQSTNPQTLQAVDRNHKIEKLFENIKRITALDNIHVHLDLIAGLPYETYGSIKKSFDNALSLKPDVLQLGFLKMLKGTKIRTQKEEFGYVYRDYPPYEVISNSFLSCGELLELKKIEQLLDKFYNSGAFFRGIEYMRDYLGDYWCFFEAFRKYFDKNNQFTLKHSRESLYKIFVGFAESVGAQPVFFDLLKLDYFTNTVNASTPAWSTDPYDTELHKRRTDLVEQYRDSVFAEFENMQIRDILKIVHFETFSYRVMDDCRKEKWVGVFTKQGKYLGEIAK